MNYGIIDDNWYVKGKYGVGKWYASERGAKIALSRKYKNVPNLRVISNKEYNESRPMVKVKNLMSGKWTEEPAGTPNFLSVGSETYWSR
jgi:hypothetical protein